MIANFIIFYPPYLTVFESFCRVLMMPDYVAVASSESQVSALDPALKKNESAKSLPT